MSKFHEMIDTLQAELASATSMMEQRSAELRLLNEQATQLRRALDAVQAVAATEEAFDSQLTPRSLFDAARQQRNEAAHRVARDATVRDKVLAILRTQLTPMSRAEVVDRMRLVDDNAVNESTVASTLSKLVGRHGVTKGPENTYYIDHTNEEGLDAPTSSPS